MPLITLDCFAPKNYGSQRRRLEFGSPQIIPHRLCERSEAIHFSPVRPN